MTPSTPERRVLVALEAGRPGLDALAAAATLAARLGAHLEALLVEDPDLLRAASLPAAFQLAAPSGAPRPVDRDAIEAELRAVAARAREALAAAVRPLGLSSSFAVARGEPWREVVEAARRADLVVLVDRGPAGRGPAVLPRVAALARSSVLVLRRGAAVGARLVVAHDGSPASDRALDLAAALAGTAARLALLVLAASPEEARRITRSARLRLGRAEEIPSTWTGGLGRERLLRAAPRHGTLLVLAAEGSRRDLGALEDLVQEIGDSILLAR